MHPSTAPVSPSEIARPDAAPREPTLPKVPSASSVGGQPCATSATECVGDVRLDLNLRNRVQRVDRDLHCGRPVSDDDLLQHREDCRFLMEECNAKADLTHDEKDRMEARSWMYRWKHAMECLSAGWKAAREAQIQQDIAQGTGCYFLDSADRALAANERGAD